MCPEIVICTTGYNCLTKFLFRLKYVYTTLTYLHRRQQRSNSFFFFASITTEVICFVLHLSITCKSKTSESIQYNVIHHRKVWSRDFFFYLHLPASLAFGKCPRFTKPRDFKETVIIQRTLTHQRQKPPCEKHHEKGKYWCGRVYYLGWFQIAPVQKWNHRERHRSADHVPKTSTCGRFFSSKTCLAIEYQRISLTTRLFK